MAAYNKIEVFVFDLGNGKHILPAAGNELRVYASNTQPLVTNEVFDVPAEIVAENGYPAGGTDIEQDYTEATGIVNAPHSSLSTPRCRKSRCYRWSPPAPTGSWAFRD